MIKLVFFARLREQLGLSEHRVTLSDNLTVQTLVEHLIASDDDSNAGSGSSKWQLLLADEVVVAKNQQVVDRDIFVEEGDELAFFPPVTGG
tara:strand:+ start:378 stop:650 length:273 start_codon:yes stop_codon:yes gene_type:complete